MGLGTESIGIFLIGNRFHVKLHILSPSSNRFYLGLGTTVLVDMILNTGMAQGVN